MATVEHPRIRPGTLEDRPYQATIAAAAVDHNTLVVLPTGLGKTAIAERVIAEYLRRFPTRSILVLGPTRPLVVQTGRSLEATLFGPTPVVATGALPPDRRERIWQPPQVIVATPQVVANDLAEGRFPLATVALIVFDEAHRAVGDYPYVAIGAANRAGPKARVLAMTASPGGRIEKIREVWAHLGIERFEYRTERSPDVMPFVQGTGVETVTVPVPVEVQHLAIRLRAAVQRQVQRLQAMPILSPVEATRRSLLGVGEFLRRSTESQRHRSGQVDARLWPAITAQAAAMKGLHALELAESQGVGALREFLLRQQRPGPNGRLAPSQRAFLSDPDVAEVLRALDAITLEHPKLARAVAIVTDELRHHPEGRVIIFTQYRDTVERLVEEFERSARGIVVPARFVGQASREQDRGLSQKEQVGTLDRFRRGEINCLVATSVAEEGLDIPATDLVVFYEPLPDVVRTIQRRGRTGRARIGRVVVLVAEGTRDQSLQRGAGGRERRMHEMLAQVEAESQRGDLRPPPPKRRVQETLLVYERPDP